MEPKVPNLLSKAYLATGLAALMLGAEPILHHGASCPTPSHTRTRYMHGLLAAVVNARSCVSFGGSYTQRRSRPLMLIPKTGGLAGLVHWRLLTSPVVRPLLSALYSARSGTSSTPLRVNFRKGLRPEKHGRNPLRKSTALRFSGVMTKHPLASSAFFARRRPSKEPSNSELALTKVSSSKGGEHPVSKSSSLTT